MNKYENIIMVLVKFDELIKDAEKNNYAVGYFEARNLETFLAVCNAAEKMRSPVIIGFSGLDFPNYVAIKKGVRKINIGKAIKEAFFLSLKSSCRQLSKNYNPYNIVGSGLENDILVIAQNAVQQVVEKYMVLFGSVNKA